jgi:hypothetical protein
LELHPIGSDVGELVKTLEGAGAVVAERDMENYKKFYSKEFLEWKNNGNVKAYAINYDNASPFFIVLNKLQWSGDIWVDQEEKITFINFHRGRAY